LSEAEADYVWREAERIARDDGEHITTNRAASTFTGSSWFIPPSVDASVV